MVGSRLLALSVVVTLGAVAGCSIEAVPDPVTVSESARPSYTPPSPPVPQTKVLADGPVSLTTTSSPTDIGISDWDGFGGSAWAVGDLVVGEFAVNSGDQPLMQVQAVDGKTGETRWYVDGVYTQINSLTNDSTPLITREDGVTLVGSWFVMGGLGVFAVDVAIGEILWHTTVLPDEPSATGTLVVTRDAVVVYDAMGGPALALDSATGEELWSLPRVYTVEAGTDHVVIVKVEDYDSPPVQRRCPAEGGRLDETEAAGARTAV